jgi:nucleotide-binding universal stress UspA family protein
MDGSEHVVLVGVNGTRASSAALRWAVDEAQRRQARLRVLRSWDAGAGLPPPALYAPAVGRFTPAQRRAVASDSLASQLRAAFGTALPCGVEAELAEGTAERVLVDRSAKADLLVLGSTSAPGPGGPIGPVIRACLSRANCPVVVVRVTPGAPPVTGQAAALRPVDRPPLPIS